MATLSGKRDHINGIYFIPLQGHPTPLYSPVPTAFQVELYAITSAAHTPLQSYSFANSVYHMNTLPALVQFLLWACFSPIIDTCCKAIYAGLFTTWPGLTSNLVRKQLPKFIETAKGHLRLARQHVRSTRTPPQPPRHHPHSPYTNL